MHNCIFCKIIARQIPATIIAEDQHILVIKDIAPKMPIHYLLLPKKHVADVQSCSSDDMVIGAQMFAMAHNLSQKIEGAQDFRLLINSGAGVGQAVFHIHMHFLAGKKLVDF